MVQDPALPHLRDGRRQSANDLLALQQRYGNNLVQKLVNRAQHLTVQPRLQLGEVDTPSELEADRLAAEITEGREVTSRPSAVQGGQWPVPPELEGSISRARSNGGQPLSGSMRSTAERSLGMDLGAVRIHADHRANQLNSELDSVAFTTGSHVFFRRDAFDTATPSGRSLIAHELAHVAQQIGATASIPSTTRGQDLRPSPAEESELIQRKFWDSRAGKPLGKQEVIRHIRDHKKRDKKKGQTRNKKKATDGNPSV